MKKGTLKNGFEFEVDEKVMDDMEFIDLLAEADDGNPLRFSKATLILLGKDQRKRLYDSIRAEDGRVPPEAFSDVFYELLEALGEEGKN